MNEQVLIYSISESASSNATLLFYNEKYFYWNNEKFKNISIGDYIFIINKLHRYVLFTKLDKVQIKTNINHSSNKTTFIDNNQNFEVDGTESNNTPWDYFVRFEIIEKLITPENWVWTNLGAGGTTYINGSRINTETAENRIKNINQIEQLTEDETISQILENCRLNFNGSKAKPISIKPIPNPNPNNQNEMNILPAIKTKPFILLAGISGTGKSRLVRTLAYKTCAKEELRKNHKKPGNFELIPVRPNWHDSSELMGYVSRINGEKYITTSFLQFIAKAWKNVDVPFLLCLDEMNLAPVEQYFAEYLSIIETRQVQGKKIGTDYLISKASFENHSLYTQLLADLGLDENDFSDGIGIPNNLVLIGSVNMDETTHSFSRKVLDRAMTFEMNNVDLTAGLDINKEDWKYPENKEDYYGFDDIIGKYTAGAEVVNEFDESKKVIDFLINLNKELEGTPFKIAYRVRDEFLIYCYYASLNQIDSNWLTNALDEMTSMKILSRIEGDETKTGSVLINLQRVLTADYKKSNTKLKEMEARLSNSGYTSFWS